MNFTEEMKDSLYRTIFAERADELMAFALDEYSKQGRGFVCLHIEPMGSRIGAVGRSYSKFDEVQRCHDKGEDCSEELTLLGIYDPACELCWAIQWPDGLSTFGRAGFKQPKTKTNIPGMKREAIPRRPTVEDAIFGGKPKNARDN